MRAIYYLNTVLTVLAVLLALQLWTTWTLGTGHDAATPAYAQSGGGIPNAGAQRKEMIDLLKQLSRQTEETNELFRSGRARVRIEAMPEGN